MSNVSSFGNIPESRKVEGRRLEGPTNNLNTDMAPIGEKKYFFDYL